MAFKKNQKRAKDGKFAKESFGLGGSDYENAYPPPVASEEKSRPAKEEQPMAFTDEQVEAIDRVAYDDYDEVKAIQRPRDHGDDYVAMTVTVEWEDEKPVITLTRNEVVAVGYAYTSDSERESWDEALENAQMNHESTESEDFADARERIEQNLEEAGVAPSGVEFREDNNVEWYDARGYSDDEVDDED